jgi:hypothetical protein
MNISNEKGFKIIVGMAAYTVIKAVLNMIIGSFSLSGLLIAAAMACAFFVFVKKFNYVIAVVLALIAISHLPANISNIGSNWIYLLEGVIDIVCAVLLVTNNDVKENYAGTINFN